MQRWAFTILAQNVLSVTLFCSLTNAETSTERSVFIAAVNPPAGFETLSQPAKTLVDVYFGNRYLTTQLVFLTLGYIELSDPQKIVRLISDLNDSDRVTSALSGQINSHPELSCPPPERPLCKTLDTSVAGVVYDESIFRVDVFINRHFMRGRAAGVRKYLPPSDAGFSLMQNVLATASGFSGNNSHHEYALNGLTMAAWKENSLFWEWNLSDVHRFSIRHLYGQRDFQGTEYSLGLMTAWGAGLNFLVDQPVVGVRAGSSDKTREDLEFSRGIPVEVYLPVRGWVEVRENERLFYSAAYEAGTQQLDTSNFPSGAYDIDIRILSDSGQLISTETRFFAKQSQLPPLGEWLFMAEVGRVVDPYNDRVFPELTERWLVRGSLSRRLSDTVATTVSVALGNHEQLAELGGYFFGRYYQLSPSLMLSDNGSKGIALNGSLLLSALTLSGNLRRVWHNHPPDENLSESGYLYSGVGRSVNQQSLSAAIPLLQGSLGYRYSLNQSYDLGEQLLAPERSHYLDCRQTLFRTFDYDGDLILSLGKSANIKTAMITVHLRFRDGRWSFQAAPRFEALTQGDAVEHTEKLRLSAGWNSRDLTDASVRVNTGVETGNGETRLDSTLQYANHLGRMTASANHGQYRDEHWTAWGINLSSRILTDGNVIAVGGEDLTESALVVKVSGRAGDVFNVRVNDTRQGYAITGSPSVIGLSPYEQYRISLSPAGETLYHFEEREKTITLYPGNVITLDYQATPLLLAYGRLLFNGEPLSGVSIDAGGSTGDTDDLGLFQLEIPASTESLQIALAEKKKCRLLLTPPKAGYLLQMGNIDLAKHGCTGKTAD